MKRLISPNRISTEVDTLGFDSNRYVRDREHSTDNRNNRMIHKAKNLISTNFRRNTEHNSIQGDGLLITWDDNFSTYSAEYRCFIPSRHTHELWQLIYFNSSGDVSFVGDKWNSEDMDAFLSIYDTVSSMIYESLDF